MSRDSLVVQWLRLCAPSEEGRSSFPGWGNKITHAEQHVFPPPPKKKKNTELKCLKRYFHHLTIVLCMESVCYLMDCGPLPGSFVHGILQVGILEWFAMLFSSGSSQPRDRTPVSCTALQADSLPAEPPWKPCTESLSLKAANTCIQCQKLLSILYVYSFIYPNNPMREGLRNLPTILD